MMLLPSIPAVQIVLPNTVCDGGTRTKLYQLLLHHFDEATLTTVQRKYFNESKGTNECVIVYSWYVRFMMPGSEIKYLQLAMCGWIWETRPILCYIYIIIYVIFISIDVRVSCWTMLFCQRVGPQKHGSTLADRPVYFISLNGLHMLSYTNYTRTRGDQGLYMLIFNPMGRKRMEMLMWGRWKISNDLFIHGPFHI